jgi:hypothetical protein
VFPNVDPRADSPRWSETKWVGCWNPDDQVGLYVHLGRFPLDRSLWWVQTIVYLPDGTMVVDRSWGRAPDPNTVTTGAFELHGTAGEVVCRYDGPGEHCSPADLARRPRGAGPSVRIAFEITGRRSRPAWDPYRGSGSTQDWAGDTHVQLHLGIIGELTVDDRHYRLDGLGFGDQSCGTRDWTGFGRHQFLSVPTASTGAVVIAVDDPEGRPRGALGALMTPDAEPVSLSSAEAPPLVDVSGAPETFEMTLVVGEDRRRWQVELLTTFLMTVTERSDYINGLDWDCPGDPLFMAESIARVVTDDGTVGYGHVERSVRRSNATLGSAAPAPAAPAGASR